MMVAHSLAEGAILYNYIFASRNRTKICHNGVVGHDPSNTSSPGGEEEEEEGRRRAGGGGGWEEGWEEGRWGGDVFA